MSGPVAMWVGSRLLCVGPRRSLCRVGARRSLCVSLSLSLCRAVLGPGALCLGARRSLCRGPASLCQGPALSVSGPGALCVGARPLCVRAQLSVSGPGYSVSGPGALSISVSGRGGVRIGARRSRCRGPALSCSAYKRVKHSHMFHSDSTLEL